MSGLRGDSSPTSLLSRLILFVDANGAATAGRAPSSQSSDRAREASASPNISPTRVKAGGAEEDEEPVAPKGFRRAGSGEAGSMEPKGFRKGPEDEEGPERTPAEEEARECCT